MATLNLTRELERLIADIVRHVEEFRHIDPARVMVCVASTRGSGIHGTYAKIHPLRFENGARSTTVRRGRRTMTCSMPAVVHRGVEMLYVVYFLVPRFFDLSFREKLITVFHELYHISAAFDGDIRRFPGRNYAHGSSTRQYNAHMATLVDAYLGARPDETLTQFLDGTMTEMRDRYRTIVGRKFPAPKITIST